MKVKLSPPQILAIGVYNVDTAIVSIGENNEDLDKMGIK